MKPLSYEFIDMLEYSSCFKSVMVAQCSACGNKWNIGNIIFYEKLILGSIRGYWPPGWRKTLRFSTTVKWSGCQAWDPTVNGMGHACIHPFGRHWKWWVWRRLGCISPASRTWSHITLWIILSWTCLLLRSGSWYCAYPVDGGSSPLLISWV